MRWGSGIVTPKFADGNAAIAWAAEDAGVRYVSHYPGSPVNRVIDVIEKNNSNNIIINHSLNEHIAALSAMGASLCGARSLVVMKHVGLNIAADPLNYAGVIKITGGMVVVVGTDPGAHSSTGEEDVHWYAPQFNLPLLEPVSVPGIYESVKNAYQISERIQLPVLVFTPGRLAYQSSLIERDKIPDEPALLRFDKNPEKLINVGKRAVENHKDHVLRLARYALETSCTTQAFNPASKYGIITRGCTYAVVCELIEGSGLGEEVHLLNIERTYPVNLEEILAFAKDKEKIIVIEDQDGFLETMIKREAFGKVSCSIYGKEYFPAWGEITYEQILDFFTQEFPSEFSNDYEQVPEIEFTCPERPGTFCEGCPHRPAFYAIDQALNACDGVIGGDIGCSSLPPHRTDWLLCMNAGIGLSQGIAQVLPERPLVSTGGEGSLFHGGLISLQSAVENNINLTHVVFDNRSIAMTGHQGSPTSSGNTDARKLFDSIGVSHIFEVDAFVPSKITHAIEKAKSLRGVKVIWIRGDCALQPNQEALRRLRERTLAIDNDRCGSCTRCYSELQCPAIVKEPVTAHLSIDMDRCRRCAACLDVCPNNAILVSDPAMEVMCD